MMVRLSLLLVALSALALGIAGCGDKGSGVALDPTVTPQKPMSELTKEEKIARIQSLPMPEDAKRKQMAAVQAGK